MAITKLQDIRRAVDIPHLAALKHRDYRLTWIANMFSGAAMWTFIVAVSWLILQKSDRSGDVGIVTFASMLPFLVVSPIAGLIADRFDRKSVARLTFMANGVITAIVAAMVIADILTLWHLALLTFVSGSMRSMQEPAMASLIPNQVPREDLLNAITLNAATRHGARFFGLLVASPMLAIDFIGPPGVLILSATLQIAGTLLISLIRTRSTGEMIPRRGIARNMADGLVYIYTNRMIAIFVMLVAVHCALVMSFDSVLPVFSRDELGAIDGSLLGYIVMGFGVGSLIGTILMAGVRNERSKGNWLLWTAILSGLSPIALAFAPNLPLNVVATIAVSAVVGGSQSTFMALTNTYVQTIAPDRLRGRISSLYILHAGGIMAFANLGYGFLADAFSSPPILYMSALIFLAFMAAFAVGLPDLRRVYRTGQAVPA